MDTIKINQKSNKMLSIVIPCHNEYDNISNTFLNITDALEKEQIPFEIIAVDDYSKDDTAKILNTWSQKDKRIRFAKNDYPPGFGFAIRKGLDIFKGDAVAIVMADESDSPQDIVKYYRKLEEGYDCVFGTRFTKYTIMRNYPLIKLILNRLSNWFIQLLFLLPYNDITNAFKCYSKETIEGIKPLLSCSFNLTVEMPLKAIIRGYSWQAIPINWFGREKGVSKWKVKELGSRYIFIVIYIWLEKILSRGDYKKGKYWLKKSTPITQN
jgi:dolichol-phosphate mannosyltransferase